MANSLITRAVAAFLCLIASLVPALAQTQLKIGMGFGLAFLPLYVCEDMKLIEKEAAAAHLDVKVSYPRMMGAAQVQSALASGAIDVGPFGVAPLLSSWSAGKNTPGQIFAVSGMTSLPLALLTGRADVHTLADLKPTDRIAVPTLTSPQVQILELQSEKLFGRSDRLRERLTAMSHADAIDALGSGSGIAAYFSSPPYSEIALRDANVHSILDSSQVMSGGFSFLVLGATRSFIQRQAQMPEIIAKAIEEAARIIRTEPRRAAQTYLSHEPSSLLSGATMRGVMGDVRNAYGSPIYGVDTIAGLMSRRGSLATPPKSWKEIVAPALLSSSSS